MKILQDLSLTELKRELETIVEKMPRYRAEQVYKWANDYVPFDEMNNIPKELRETLKENGATFFAKKPLDLLEIFK